MNKGKIMNTPEFVEKTSFLACIQLLELIQDNTKQFRSAQQYQEYFSFMIAEAIKEQKKTNKLK